MPASARSPRISDGSTGGHTRPTSSIRISSRSPGRSGCRPSGSRTWPRCRLPWAGRRRPLDRRSSCWRLRWASRGERRPSTVTGTSTPELTDLLIRPATADDAGATYDVLVEASGHLARSRGWTPTAWPAAPSERFLAFRASVLRHDPGGFWVAETDGRQVAFGIAVQREHVWYLAALHVRPAWQSRGVGAEIVRRALAAAPRDSLLTVGADARNPVSQALYG